MNKRGQFFLIAALVIVAILVGLGTVYTSVKTQKEDQSVYDLSSEINEEASFVLDNGVFYATSPQQVSTNIENLTNFYAAANPGSNIIVVYGNSTVLNIIYYNNTETGDVGVSSGGADAALTIRARNVQKGTLIPHQQNVTVALSEDATYNFEITSGQNFYLIIKKDREDETIVAE